MYSRDNIFSFSNNKKEIRRRIWTILCLFIILFCLLIWKIANHMYFKSEPLKVMADAQYTIDERYGLQYNLVDYKGISLLDYAINYYAIIDPVDYLRFNEYTSKYDLEALTITLRNYNRDYDLEKIKGIGSSQKLRYKIDEQTFDKLKDIKGVKGFYAFAANDAIDGGAWKIESLLTNTKYNNVEGKLVTKSENSLEMQIYNKTKNNEYSKIRFIKGVDGDISEGNRIEPINNVNVRLTLDKEIQEKVEAILHEEKYKKYKQIGVVLMESSSGKIRAMVQKDDNAYNVNLGYPSTNGAKPGSIFKVIVDEAGIDLNLIDNSRKYTIESKIFNQEPFKGTTFTISEALAKSSNNIFAQLGQIVEFQNIYDYAEKQGMLSKVLNLQQEDVGKFWGGSSSGDTSQTAIGQNVTITPLEALSIPNTIINNGIYVQPSIVDAYVNENNKVLEKIIPKTTRILKKETAETVKSHMMDVVTKGTGGEAYIRGMDMGGKTGTTTYIDKGITQSDGWFVGFFNLNNKNYSMVVYVNNIEMNEKGIDEEGGDTAAPIFKKVVNSLMQTD